MNLLFSRDALAEVSCHSLRFFVCADNLYIFAACPKFWPKRCRFYAFPLKDIATTPSHLKKVVFTCAKSGSVSYVSYLLDYFQYHPCMVLTTYIWLIFRVNVGRNISPMDAMSVDLSVNMAKHPNILMTSFSRPSFWFLAGIFGWSASTNGSVHSCHMKAPHCQKRRDLVKWHDRQKTAYRIGFIYQVFPLYHMYTVYFLLNWLNACLYDSLTSGVVHLQTWSPLSMVERVKLIRLTRTAAVTPLHCCIHLRYWKRIDRHKCHAALRCWLIQR